MIQLYVYWAGGRNDTASDIACNNARLGDTGFGPGSILHRIFLKCGIPLCSNNIEMDTISQIHNIYFKSSQHSYMFHLPKYSHHQAAQKLKKETIYINVVGEILALQNKMHI
jgi:hypothetical protein